MSNSYYSDDELRTIGLGKVGKNVLISKKASIYSPGAVVVGDNVRVDDFCVLAGGSELRLGNNVHVACYCGLFAGSGIVLEDFAGLSARVLIYSESDDYSGRSMTNPTVPEKYRPGLHKGRVVLGRHVIVGASTTILPGVSIGEGAAVGAHSLVTTDCDDWWIYLGAPAVKRKPRERSLLALERAFLADA